MMNPKIVNALSAMAILAAPPAIASAFSQMDAGKDFTYAASAAREGFSSILPTRRHAPHGPQKFYN